MTRTRQLLRTGAGLAIAAMLALTACSAGPSSSAAASSRGPGRPPGSTTTIPNTPAGQQLEWFLAAAGSLPISARQARAHFTQRFLNHVSAAELTKLLQRVVPDEGVQLRWVKAVSPTKLRAAVSVGQQPGRVELATGAGGKISRLLLHPPRPQPQAAPRSWADFDRRLAELAPEVSALVARVTPAGRCRPVHAVHPDAVRPLGSVFKLYVLGAVARQIRSGRLAWDQQLTLHPADKSPGGVLVDKPVGTHLTVRQVAQKMIAISDNTAADLLIHTVGRRTVEQTLQVMGSAHVDRNIPFPTTREMSVLKGASYPRYRDAYLSRLTPAARRDYLNQTVDAVPLRRIDPWRKPRDIHTLEWFASAADICAAYAWLGRQAGRPGMAPLGAILSANDGGLNLDPDRWPRVWFKGGSEPGVLTTAWRARSAGGTTIVTVLMAANPDQPLEPGAIAEMISLARGAFRLASG